MANFITELKVKSFTEAHNTHPTFEEMEKYYLYFPKMKELFSKEVLEKALESLWFTDITTIEKVRENKINYFIKQDYEIVSLTPTLEKMEEWRGEWHREYYSKAYRFWVPTGYEHNYGKYVRKCLELTIPWFNKFTWNVFSINSYNDWIYLVCNPTDDIKVNTSVYVPVSALLNKDLDKIIQTHTNYFKSYYGKSEEYKEYLNQALSLLESDEFKWFSKFLE